MAPSATVIPLVWGFILFVFYWVPTLSFFFPLSVLDILQNRKQGCGAMNVYMPTGFPNTLMQNNIIEPNIKKKLFRV